jgi:hypothetical protein
MTREAIAAARFLASTALKKATISAIQTTSAPVLPAHNAVVRVTAMTATG